MSLSVHIAKSLAVVSLLVSVSCVRTPHGQETTRSIRVRYVVEDPVVDVLSLADLGAVSWIKVEQMIDAKTVTLMVRGWSDKGEEVLATIVGVYEETAGGYLRMFPSGKVNLTDNEYSKVAREAYGERAPAEWLPAFMDNGPNKSVAVFAGRMDQVPQIRSFQLQDGKYRQVDERK